MVTECFAPVRGSAIRVTGLTSKGAIPTPAEFVTSKSVATVRVSEVVTSGSTDEMKTAEDKRRLRFISAPETIRHKVDIEFLRVDPEMLRLVAGVELVYKDVAGFGEVPFGVALFGSEAGTVVGFDSSTRLKATSFALEVWSKLDSASAQVADSVEYEGFDEAPFDVGPFDDAWRAEYVNCSKRRWGYTLFPFLRGGRLSGFQFADGLVSFNLVGAQTRRNPGWGVGPYDLSGPFERLSDPVSRNTSWRMFITNAAPPAQVDGIQYRWDVLDNGTAGNPMPDPNAPLVVDGGGADAGQGIIDGGRA